MLRGFVKNWASAIEAFGYFVSLLTEIDIRPLPATSDRPSGAWTMPRSPYSVALVSLIVRTRFGPV